MSRQFNKVAEEHTPAASPVAALSEQELQILKLFASGKNSPEIAKAYRSAFRLSATIFTTSTRSYGLTIGLKL